MRFADGVKAKVIGLGNVGKDDSHKISDVLLVNGLTHNLLSISQFCDLDLDVIFKKNGCFVKDSSGKTILQGKRLGNTYVIHLKDLEDQDVKCLSSFAEDKWVWHRKLGHAHMRLISEIS